jgi:hypothetical protein
MDLNGVYHLIGISWGYPGDFGGIANCGWGIGIQLLDITS